MTAGADSDDGRPNDGTAGSDRSDRETYGLVGVPRAHRRRRRRRRRGFGAAFLLAGSLAALGIVLAWRAPEPAAEPTG